MGTKRRSVLALMYRVLQWGTHLVSVWQVESVVYFILFYFRFISQRPVLWKYVSFQPFSFYLRRDICRICYTAGAKTFIVMDHQVLGESAALSWDSSVVHVALYISPRMIYIYFFSSSIYSRKQGPALSKQRVYLMTGSRRDLSSNQRIFWCRKLAP